MREVLIDYNDALRLVNDEIAEEGPEYAYETSPTRPCANVVYQGGEWVGSCLVGRVLISAGVDGQDFAEYRCRDGDVFDVLAAMPGLGMTSKALNFLMAAQSRQDMGSEWGDVVEYAVAEATRTEHDDVHFL